MEKEEEDKYYHTEITEIIRGKYQLRNRKRKTIVSIECVQHDRSTLKAFIRNFSTLARIMGSQSVENREIKRNR